MRQLLRTLVVVALIAGAVIAATRWPRINDVEGAREFAAPEAAVGRAAKAAVAALPGWTFVGAGQGPGGTSIQALATKPAPLKTEMTITIRRQGGKTAVRARARSQFGPWDFGQGARHIEAFMAELDRRLELGGAPSHPPDPAPK